MMPVIAHINLFVDSSKAQAVCYNKRVYVIILWQIVISFFEFFDLFRVEDVNSFVIRGQRTVFSQKIDEVVTVY